MKCPHCGKEISEFALNCPNCGGNPKEGATEKVDKKAKNVAKTSNVREIILSLIGTIIAFIFAIMPAHQYMPGEATWLMEYVVAGVILIIIASISGTIKVAVKNVFFYIASVIFAISDFILRDRYINSNFGSNTIAILKSSKGVWFLYNTFKVSHIIIVILGIAFAVALICKIKQLKDFK